MRDRAFWRVLAICLPIYLACAKGHVEIWDTGTSLHTAQAIVARGQMDIPYSESETLRGPDGRNYSKYGIGLALYFVPCVVVSNVLSRFTHFPADQLTGFLVSFLNIPFAALTLILFGKLLKLLGITGVYLWLLPLALGLGTLAWRYAGYDFSEEMQMGLLMLAFYGVVKGAPKAVFRGGCGFAVLFLVKLLYAAFLPLFLVYLLTRPGALRERVRNTAIFAFPFVLAACFVAWLNVVRFGNPFESGYGGEAHQFFPGQLWYTLPRLLFSLDKGLFVFCPILILGLFGWREFAARHRPEAVLCSAILIGNLLLAGAWHSWVGGWSWGPRLLVPTIPLWLLPAAFCFKERQSRAAVCIVSVLTGISIVAQIPGVLVKDLEIHEIKEKLLTAQERRSAPSDYVTSCLLFWHKVRGRKEVYRVSDFHIPGDRAIDLTGYRTFIGFNLWSELIGRQMNKPALRLLPVLVLVLLIVCLSVVGARMRKAGHGEAAVSGPSGA